MRWTGCSALCGTMSVRRVTDPNEVVRRRLSLRARARIKGTSNNANFFIELIAGASVESLSRPSGNLTGVTSLGRELAGKRLEILHKLVPVAHTIALLTRRVDGPEPIAMQSAAGALGIRLLSLSAATEGEVAEVFATIIEQHAGALVLSSNANFPATIDQILLLALRHAVPSLFFDRDEVAREGSRVTEPRGAN